MRIDAPQIPLLPVGGANADVAPGETGPDGGVFSLGKGAADDTGPLPGVGFAAEPPDMAPPLRLGTEVALPATTITTHEVLATPVADGPAPPSARELPVTAQAPGGPTTSRPTGADVAADLRGKARLPAPPMAPDRLARSPESDLAPAAPAPGSGAAVKRDPAPAWNAPGEGRIARPTTRPHGRLELGQGPTPAAVPRQEAAHDDRPPTAGETARMMPARGTPLHIVPHLSGLARDSFAPGRSPAISAPAEQPSRPVADPRPIRTAAATRGIAVPPEPASSPSSSGGLDPKPAEMPSVKEAVVYPQAMPDGADPRTGQFPRGDRTATGQGAGDAVGITQREPKGAGASGPPPESSSRLDPAATQPRPDPSARPVPERTGPDPHRREAPVPDLPSPPGSQRSAPPQMPPIPASNLRDAVPSTLGEGPPLSASAAFDGMGPERAPDAARATADQNAPRADPTRAPAQQIVDIVRRLPEGAVEVRLSPEELGRVRLTVSPAETGITVSIQAERADTLDLLRRHGDALIADLAAEGFADASLDFGRDSRSGGDAGPDVAGDPLHTDTEPPRDAIRQSRQTGLPQGRSIDLRL